METGWSLVGRRSRSSSFAPFVFAFVLARAFSVRSRCSGAGARLALGPLGIVGVVLGTPALPEDQVDVAPAKRAAPISIG